MLISRFPAGLRRATVADALLRAAAASATQAGAFFIRLVQELSRPWHRVPRERKSPAELIARTSAKTWRLLWVGVLAVLPVAACLGEELGREAPALQVTNWLRGVPVDLKRTGLRRADGVDATLQPEAASATQAGTNRVDVILFWETWCDSCMASLPHLVDLQQKLRPAGVELIGVSPETPEAVKGFLANSDVGPKINFAIACDANRKTFESYMTAFGQSQVPRAFVVDQRGALVWYGHPLAGLEFILQQILADKFDLEATKKTLGAEKLQEEYFRQAATNSGAAEVPKLGRKILSDGAGNPWLMNNFAWRILQDWRLEKRDWELAVHASKSACVATEWQRPTFLDTHALALFSNGDATEAIRIQKRAIALCTNEILRARLEQTLKTFETGRTNNAAR